MCLKAVKKGRSTMETENGRKNQDKLISHCKDYKGTDNKKEAGKYLLESMGKECKKMGWDGFECLNNWDK
jgi:hypothetical protein